MSASYKAFKQQIYKQDEYSLVPLRFGDRFDIMKWRNEQMFHLRQLQLLTLEKQDEYFKTVVKSLFSKKQPEQILFSFLKHDKCIGYGGLVHINWVDKNAEVSFIMDTKLERDEFESLWEIYLSLLKKVAFDNLSFHKIYTYAFDLRPRLYKALEDAGFSKDATLKEHCFFENRFIDVVIHSLIGNSFILEKASSHHLDQTFQWAKDPQVRSFSFNKSIISMEEHRTWFNSKLNDQDCIFFIAYSNKSPIGSIRFDISKGNALISYLIDPAYQGRGFGTKILTKGIEELKKHKLDLKSIYGYVQPNNKASIRIFEKLHFNVKKDKENLYFYQNLK